MFWSKSADEFDEHERIRFVFNIGITFDLSERDVFIRFISDLCKSISAVTGGIRYSQGIGTWRSDGNSEPPYNGTLERESSYNFIVIVDPKSLNTFGGCNTVREIAEMLQSRLRTVYEYHDNLPIQWVNVEAERVYVSHFDITGS